MFCYQSNFASQCQIMDSDTFARFLVSDDVVQRIRAYRSRRADLESLKSQIDALRNSANATSTEVKAEIRKLSAQASEISKLKTGLPTLMYQATFNESYSKKGNLGRWRNQRAAVLNGLFMLDVDHVDNPREKLLTLVNDSGLTFDEDMTQKERIAEWANQLGVKLVHVTPSGKGLRFVCVCDIETGNLADNQKAMAEKLGVQEDISCKDASRCSFCPMFEDILFIDKTIFTYENKQYDERYGDQYRRGDSRYTANTNRGSSSAGNRANGNTVMPTVAPIGSGGQSSGTSEGKDGGTDKYAAILKEGYHGKKYSEILDKWIHVVNGGRPSSGDRHRVLYQAACDLRYICDFDEHLLARILKECSVGEELCGEGREAELDNIARDACALQRWRSIPKRMQNVLQAAGVQLSFSGHNTQGAGATDGIDFEYWYQRLRVLLEDSPGFREAVKPLPDHHKMAGVLASGAMFGTYLTRAWWEHFDGKDYRLSFLVYIIGSAASGKSFIVELDRLIMAPMIAADKVGREWERQYKEEMKRRNASGNKSKGEAPEQQHPVIRYVPSSISNAMLYRRLMDAVDNNTFGSDGNPLHLHCYTLEPELATALRAQTGSWAGKNDIELKSFHNEFAGVDFANDASVNGVIQVNWNQVVSGTGEAMNRKIKPSTVLDGLVTRLCLFPMPSNDFAMIEKRSALRDHEREEYLRSIGLKLDQVKGELKIQRLVDYCYDYEAKLTEEAKREDDYCLDYFRKRIPVIMIRYTIVRIVLREIDKILRGESYDVLDSDLEFAKLIGDFCLATQIYMFGEQVMQAQQREREGFVPRKRQEKVRHMYKALPEILTTETLVDGGFCADVNRASTVLRRWLEDGLIEKIDLHQYKKKYKEIPV